MTSDNAPLAVTGSVPQAEAMVWDQTAQRESRARRVKVIGPPAFSLGTIVAGVRTLLQYKDLLYTLSLFRLKVRYKQSLLGWLWAALQPVALMGIYTFIFAHVTTVNTGGVAYPAFVFCGLLPWIFFSTSIASAVHGMVAYPTLLTKMYFPREIIPLSYLAAGITDFLIASVILAGILAHYRVVPTWNLLYILPILLVLAGFAAAVAIFFAAVHVRFRDVGLALPFLLQVWMFATPVVYSLQAVPMSWRRFYLLDPVASAIDMFRGVVIYGRAPDTFNLAVSAGITFAALTFAYGYFKASEAAMADLV